MSKLKNYIKRGIYYILHGHPIIKVTPTISLLNANELLKGRTALITGGTSGIGYAIAKEFVKSGAFVVITSRNSIKASNSANEILTELNVNSGCIGVEMDNLNTQAIEKQFQNILELVPNKKISILVNNAGIGGGDIRNSSEEEFNNVINTNLKGTFFLSRIIANHMIKENIKGNILNIGSSSGIRPAISAYMLSKWGIRGLTEGLSRLLISHDIVVNAIAPGPTATPMQGFGVEFN
jgi:3-oxoacyl-[acyl-carrier protein] reductase